MTPARVIPEHSPQRKALDYVLLGLVLLSVFIANLVIFLLFEGTVAVISSFFYIPIIFAAFQYPRRGIFSSATMGLVFLAVIYSLLNMTPVTVTTATVQFYVFVAVGTLVSRLSEESREQQIRYQGIFEHSQAGVMLVRRSDQRILEVNRRGADLLGSSPMDLAGRPLSSFWLDMEERDRFFRRLDAEGTITDYETRVLGEQASMRWILVSAGMISADLVVCAMVDISRRRRSEEEIQRRNRELGLMNRIIATSTSGDAAAEIFPLAVDAALDYLECEAGAIYLLDPERRTWELRYHTGINPAHLDALSRLPVQGTLLDRAVGSGGPVWLHEHEERGLPPGLDSFRSVAVIPLISSPGILGFLVAGCSREEPLFGGKEKGVLESLGREVGGAIERVQLRHDLEEALKQANLYLDIMVHDINNDATAALGYGSLLLERLGGEEGEQLGRLLSRIRHSSETIRDVSTIRKIRSSAAVLQQIPLDPVIRQEIGQFPDTDIRYAGTGLSVCADDLVSVIFTNLLSNSVKYSGPGVRIEIAVTESSGWAGITVRDNGPGIPENLRPHLFERFSHGPAKKSGMGLGLYLTRMLVERYGGTIRVDDPPGTEDRPGFSVTFRLKVPSPGEEACGAALDRGR